jgi:cell wall-associated NlpC family hydrolase
MNQTKKGLISIAVFIVSFYFLTSFVFAQENSKGIVTASVLNLRSGPGISKDVIGSLFKNKQIAILGDSGDWYKVETSAGKVGWVLKKYITKVTSTVSRATTVVKSDSKGIVTASALNLRSGPSTSDGVLESLFKNKQITILNTSNSWYKVKTSSGKVGWVLKKYISTDTSKVSRGDTVLRSASSTLSNATELLGYAKKYLDVRYVWGGTSPNGFDCSGFVQFVYKHFGIKIDRVAHDQAKEGTYVNKSDLLPGDLVFFDTNGGHNYINHVGMYIGESKFIHASSGHGEVMITDISHGFYANTYMTARRIIK